MYDRLLVSTTSFTPTLRGLNKVHNKKMERVVGAAVRRITFLKKKYDSLSADL